MSDILSVLSQKVTELSKKYNDLVSAGKKIYELPWQSILKSDSKIPVSSSGGSEHITVGQIIDAVQIKQSNRLLGVGNITLSGNNLTIKAQVSALINGVTCLQNQDTLINVPFSSSGTIRIDIIIINSNGAVSRVAGVETIGIALEPSVPLDTVVITKLNITDNSLSNTPPVLGLTDKAASHPKGLYNADTNTPTLVNGIGNVGDYYICNVAGDFAGTYYSVNDRIEYDGLVWYKAVDNNQHTPLTSDSLGLATDTFPQADVIAQEDYIDFTVATSKKKYKMLFLTFLENLANVFQTKLTSGQTLKTVNNTSLLGSGNVDVIFTPIYHEVLSSSLNTQDVTGVKNYLNALTPNIVISSNSMLKVIVTDTGQIFEIKVNGRTIGSGQTPLAIIDILKVTKNCVIGFHRFNGANFNPASNTAYYFSGSEVAQSPAISPVLRTIKAMCTGRIKKIHFTHYAGLAGNVSDNYIVQIVNITKSETLTLTSTYKIITNRNFLNLDVEEDLQTIFNINKNDELSLKVTVPVLTANPTNLSFWCEFTIE